LVQVLLPILLEGVRVCRAPWQPPKPTPERALRDRQDPMARIRYHRKGGQPATIAGKIFLSLFLGAFLCGGLFFFGLLGRELWQTVQTYRWPALSCQILESEVNRRQDSSEKPYGVRIRYQYDWEGQTYTSDQTSLNARAFGDFQKAQRLSSRYAAGSSATCYVNAEDPTQAVLLREGLWPALFLVVPLVFITVGAAGIYLTWTVTVSQEG